jgi:hypothetical protein
VLRAIRRCLQKDPKRRLRHIADILHDLEETSEPNISPSPAQRTQRLSTSTALIILAVILALALAGRSWFQKPPSPKAVEWYGERLGGPTLAMGPRLSRDGQLLAFSALIDGQSQVAVMKPQSGNWRTLTRTRIRGVVQDMTWSRDATRIFFDRYFDVPQGIYSVPALGGEERLVLENAMSPQALADGTLVVTQINASRSLQLFRLWPDSSRLEALPALLADFLIPAVRVLSDGHHAVFYGRPSDANSPSNGIYIIDLDSKQLRRLAPSVNITNQSWGLGLWGMALAATPDGRFVRFDLPSGNLHRIVEVPTDGSDSVHTLVTLTQRPLFLDVANDGSMYVDQIEQTPELISFSPVSGKLERLPMRRFMKNRLSYRCPTGVSFSTHKQWAGRRLYFWLQANKRSPSSTQKNPQGCRPRPSAKIVLHLSSEPVRTKR